jgi:moderate conductance mechanosensitive channel
VATEGGQRATGAHLSAAFIIVLPASRLSGDVVLGRIPAEPEFRYRAHGAREDAAGAVPQRLHHRARGLVGMLALAQIGVNIAPLLAGAGVLGLAIGFGAQKFVQDIITGIFIQFENIMNEGDVVEVAGLTGVVER